MKGKRSGSPSGLTIQLLDGSPIKIGDNLELPRIRVDRSIRGRALDFLEAGFVSNRLPLEAVRLPGPGGTLPHADLTIKISRLPKGGSLVLRGGGGLKIESDKAPNLLYRPWVAAEAATGATWSAVKQIGRVIGWTAAGKATLFTWIGLTREVWKMVESVGKAQAAVREAKSIEFNGIEAVVLSALAWLRYDRGELEFPEVEIAVKVQDVADSLEIGGHVLEKAVHNALQALAKVGCVERTQAPQPRWRILEDFEVDTGAREILRTP